MDIFGYLRQKKEKALQFIDRDRSIAGTQLAQGGLGNRVSSFVGDARNTARLRNQAASDRFGSWQAQNRRSIEDPNNPYNVSARKHFDPMASFGSGMIRSQLGFTGAENLLPEGNWRDSATYKYQTPTGNIAEKAGYVAGIPLGAFSRGGSLLNIAKNIAVGGLMGGGFTAGGTLVNEQRLPTAEELYQGTKDGAKMSWLFPATSALTNKFISKAGTALPKLLPYTDEAIGTLSGRAGNTLVKDGVKAALPQIGRLAGRNVLREMAETPLETLAMGAQEALQPDEERTIAQILSDRFVGDLVGNAMFGAGKTGASMAIPTFKRGRANADNLINSRAEAEGVSPQAYMQTGGGNPIAGAEKIGDVLSRRQDGVPTSQVQAQAKMLADKSGFDEKAVAQIINRHGFDKAERALGYMRESKTEIKNPVAYANSLITTDYYTKPAPSKGIPETSEAYTDSLMQTELDNYKPNVSPEAEAEARIIAKELGIKSIEQFDALAKEVEANMNGETKFDQTKDFAEGDRAVAATKDFNESIENFDGEVPKEVEADMAKGDDVKDFSEGDRAVAATKDFNEAIENFDGDASTPKLESEISKVERQIMKTAAENNRPMLLVDVQHKATTDGLSRQEYLAYIKQFNRLTKSVRGTSSTTKMTPLQQYEATMRAGRKAQPTKGVETVEDMSQNEIAAMLNPSQAEVVKGVVAETPKSIQEIAQETKILEPNVRRILGVGAKDGTFERVDKGVYVLSKDGKDTAYVETASALEALPKLAASGFKADMVFLDVPYNTPAVRGGNRGVKYALISPEEFGQVLDSTSAILKNDDSAIFYMFSRAKSGLKQMMKYNQELTKRGFQVVAEGNYTKLQKDGVTKVRNMRGNVIEPEGILLLSRSGEVNGETDLPLNFELVRPKGYQTEKSADLLDALILRGTKVGDTVLDPFAGSGVSLAQAVKLGRKAYGIEINPKAVEEHIKPKLREAIKSIPSSKPIEEILTPQKPDVVPTAKPIAEVLSPKVSDDYMDSLVASETQAPKPKIDFSEDMKKVESTNPFTEGERMANETQTPRAEYKPALNAAELLSRVKRASTPDEIIAVNKDIPRMAEAIEKRFIKDGTSLDKVVDDLEAGRETKHTKTLTKWFDTFKARAEADGLEIPTRENFFTHITQERAGEIISNGADPDTFGDMFTKPYFGEKRTGKLTDYAKTKEALTAYAVEAMKNAHLTDAEKTGLKTSREIVKEYRGEDKAEPEESVRSIGDWFNKIFGATPMKPSVDVVGKVRSDFKDFQKTTGDTTEPTVYKARRKAALREGIASLFRSDSDRAELAGDPFYKAFFEPFRNYERNSNKYATEIGKLSDAELDGTFKLEPGNKQDLTRDEKIARLLINNRRRELAGAINTFKKNAEGAEFEEAWLKELANNIFETYVGSEVKTPKMVDNILGAVRAQSGRGALGLNVASAVNNVFELKRAFATMEPAAQKRAVERVMAGEKFVEKYGINSKGATALERKAARSQMGKLIEKGDSVLFYMFDKTENFKDEVMLAGFEEQGIKKGLKGAELERYVIQKFDKFAVKYGKGQDIGLFKSNAFKTLFQFGQYPLKDFVIFTDKAKGAIQGDKGDQAYAMKYAFASAAQMLLFKAVLGVTGFGGQTSTPLDLATQFFGRKEIPLSPAAQSLLMMGQMATDSLSGTEVDDYEQNQREKSLTRSLTTTAVPASNQLWFKTKGAIDAQNQGYQETFGGNVANPVSTDPITKGKTLFFGQSYDPKRQEHSKNYQESVKNDQIGTASLDKYQSAAFKALPRDQQQAYYDTQVAGNQVKADKKDVVESLKTEEPGFLDRLFNKDKTVGADKLKDTIFEGKSATSNSIEDRMDVFKSLNLYLDDDTISDEQKSALLKASGASEEDYEFYALASKDQDVKLQELLPQLDNMEHEDMMKLLANSRRVVGGKQLLGSEMITYLYDMDYISEDEKKYLSALKFDEVSQKFYLSKSYKGGGSGSGSSKPKVAKMGKLDLAKMSRPKSLKSLLGSLDNSSSRKTIDEILYNAPKSKVEKPSDLWF